jgi:hypothetical protein
MESKETKVHEIVIHRNLATTGTPIATWPIGQLKTGMDESVLEGQQIKQRRGNR